MRLHKKREGRDALVATEYLFAGGQSDCVGYAKFLIVWEKDGNGRVEKWWIESADEYITNSIGGNE